MIDCPEPAASQRSGRQPIPITAYWWHELVGFELPLVWCTNSILVQIGRGFCFAVALLWFFVTLFMASGQVRHCQQIDTIRDYATQLFYSRI